MIIKKKTPNTFTPIELTITIESQSEFDTLFSVVNANTDRLWAFILQHDCVIGKESTVGTWSEISSALFDVLNSNTTNHD